MRDLVIETITAAAAQNPKLMLIVGDLGFGVLDKYRAQLPRQFINAGVSEQNMTGLAVGMALSGWVACTYSIANFPTLRCLEQIRNDACYHNAAVKVFSVGAGLSYGQLGASHHATEDIGILRALPGLRLLCPGDDFEAVGCTQAALEIEGTVVVRVDKSSAGQTRMPGERFQLGVARRLREGEDLTLVSSGAILGEVLAAADSLAQQRITCRVLSLSSLKPVDSQALVQAAHETSGLVTVEEHSLDGGLGSIVAETLLDNGCAPKLFRRIGLPGDFTSMVGDQRYLRTRYGLDAPAIVAQVRQLLACQQPKNAEACSSALLRA